MCTEFIQALLLLLFTCYHLFCQEHPKGFMLWPFAYCSFSHEWWSINKHQGVWKCAWRENEYQIVPKSLNTLLFKFMNLRIYLFYTKFIVPDNVYFYFHSPLLFASTFSIPLTIYLSPTFCSNTSHFLIYNQLIWLRT